MEIVLTISLTLFQCAQTGITRVLAEQLFDAKEPIAFRQMVAAAHGAALKRIVLLGKITEIGNEFRS